MERMRELSRPGVPIRPLQVPGWPPGGSLMEVMVTRKVDSHHTNKKYECLLVDLMNDPTFHFTITNGRLVKADLMPTDEFVLDLCHYLAKQSPTFRRELFEMAIRLDFPAEPSPRKQSRPGGNNVVDFM